ncbi:MAG: L,D-transpeptidase family protein, partial [Pseudobdellovibrionaceae bacterium]
MNHHFMNRMTTWLQIAVVFFSLLGAASLQAQTPTTINNRIWGTISTEELSLMAQFILKVVPEHGLYLTPGEEQLVEQIRYAGDPEQYRRQITALFIMSAKQIFTGRITGTHVATDIRYGQKKMGDDKLRKMVADAMGSVDDLINFLVPKFADYKMLVNMLGRLKAAELDGSWKQIGYLAKSLRLGSKSADVARVKERLKTLGFQIDSMDTRMDEQTVAAINDIQLQNKKKPDGVLSPDGATHQYLDIPLQERIAQVRADLEKLRWLPQEPDQKYIFVNLAFSSFLLVDFTQENPVVFNFKTINGRVERKTPSMVDRVHQVILNPFWTVPKTIFMEDKVPAIQGLDPFQIRNYFDQNRYVVVAPNMRDQWDPASIDWLNVNSERAGFFIRQLPNYNNSLGVVRFSLTNGEAIFLHDTGDRHLFNQTNRLLSSGCVRLEKPIDLAAYLLQGTVWDRPTIENFVAKPGQVLENETRINLDSSMPVYMLPVTSHMSADGVMRFTSDVYGHNESIRALVNYMLPLMDVSN